MRRTSDHPNQEGDSSELSPSDIVDDLLVGSSIPPPVKEGLFRAINRLCSAAIDIPTAYLEGRADERRAETQARIQMVKTTADQIAQQMRTDPEYARRAVTQFSRKILREQANLDTIALNSVRLIQSDSDVVNDSEVDATLDDDWLNSFDTEARAKSTKEMQEYFSRILAGEIKHPQSYSIKSLKILGNLDARTAKLFEKFCSMSIQSDNESLNVHDARVLSLGKSASDNSLAKFGLNFSDLNLCPTIWLR